MKRDTVEISDQARRACDHTLIEDGADMTMRDCEEPIVRTGQGCYEQWLDDDDETWLDVGLALAILGALGLLWYVATM